MHFFAHIYILFVCRQRFCKIFSVVNITSFPDTKRTIHLFQSVPMNVIVLLLVHRIFEYICDLSDRQSNITAYQWATY